MKRIGFYRRSGIPGKLAGIKERIVWQLSKRPMTGSELAKILDLQLHIVNEHMRYMDRSDAVAKISYGEWFTSEDGKRDRLYTFEGMGSGVFPKAGKGILVSHRSAKRSDPGMRKECIEKAKRRARLIAAGLYVDEMG